MSDAGLTSRLRLVWSEYLRSVKEILPWKWVLMAVLLAVPALLFGKSIKYFIAFIAHNMFFLQAFVLWRHCRSRRWIYAFISVLVLLFLFLIAGTIALKSFASLGVLLKLLFWVLVFVVFLYLCVAMLGAVIAYPLIIFMIVFMVLFLSEDKNDVRHPDLAIPQKSNISY